jgi:hypothetical protein
VAVPKTIFVILLLAAGVLVAPAPPVWACSCAQIDPLGFADTAFAGTVLSIDQGDVESAIVFEVDSLVKGSADRRITLHTTNNDASCGYAFMVGRSYRVFAKAGRTTLCSGNTEMTPAPVSSAVAVPPDPGPRSHSASKSGWAIATGVGLVVLGLLLIRRRRDPQEPGRHLFRRRRKEPRNPQ